MNAMRKTRLGDGQREREGKEHGEGKSGSLTMTVWAEPYVERTGKMMGGVLQEEGRVKCTVSEQITAWE